MPDVPPPPTLGLRLIQSIALHPLVLLRCHKRGVSNASSTAPAPFQLGPTANVALVEKHRIRVHTESIWTVRRILGI